MNRRTFLKGTMTLFGATMLSTTALSNLSRKAALPTIKAESVAHAFQFGAVGDGATDDTAALQASVNYAATVGGTVRIGVGRFKTSKIIIPDGVVLG